MSSAMELNQDTLQQIGEYVKRHLPEWEREATGRTGAADTGGRGLSAEEVRRDIALGERIVRVEEELKTQRDLIREGFAEAARRFEEQTVTINKRFEEQTAGINARFDDVNRRFDDVNKRFEEQTVSINARFDDVNKRFEEQTANVNKRFEEQTANINKRFEEQTANINARSDDVNKRFEDMHRYTNRWMVLISIFLAMIGAMPWLMGAY